MDDEKRDCVPSALSFFLEKVGKTFWFCDFFLYLKHSAFTLVKRDVNKVCERVTICQYKEYDLGTPSITVYKRIRAWTLGQSLPV